MSEAKYFIAIDLGAESGRVMIGEMTNNKLSLNEVHRFANGPVTENDTLRWDFKHIFAQIKTGLKQAIAACSVPPLAIGIDTWGVDYGLLDEDGLLIENPYHYRDSRTDETMQQCFDLIGKRYLYHETGLQFMQFNTVFQLYAAKQANDAALNKASTLLMIPDLIAYYLSGHKQAEYTIASTTALLEPHTKTWHKALFEKLGLPLQIMPEIVQPGIASTQLSDLLCREFDCEAIPVVTTGCHDTANAVAAVPVTMVKKWAYLSSGTWSLIGIETPSPIINDDSFDDQFTNEGGVENTIRLLKNIMGLWILQECRRQWERDGDALDYTTITEIASAVTPFYGVINPNDDSFFAPGDMPTRVNAYLAKTNQATTQDKGQMCRIILESLALNYRWALEKLEHLSKDRIEVLHIVGGGTQNKLLNQFAANAINCPVVTGPIEATACGNIIMQAIATETIADLAAGRKMINDSYKVDTYQPQDVDTWDTAYQKAVSLFNTE